VAHGVEGHGPIDILLGSNRGKVGHLHDRRSLGSHELSATTEGCPIALD
jgi:hypothetical protein